MTQVDKALKGYPKSFEVSLNYAKDPLKQLVNFSKVVERHLEDQLNPSKGFNLVQTLGFTLKKVTADYNE